MSHESTPMASNRFGSWESPITADYVHAGEIARGHARADGEDVLWLETRPAEEGRTVLVRRSPDGAVRDVSLPGQDVRTTLHEYGGGDYAVRDGVVLYVVRDEQQVWIAREGRDPRPITAPSAGLVRYAGFCLDPERGVAWCTREDQRDSTLEPVTSLVRLDLDAEAEGYGVVVVPGRERPRAESGTTGSSADGSDAAPDFVMDPALSPDRSQLAWVTWNHPGMAWEGTQLWVAYLDAEGNVDEPGVVAGGPGHSIEQPTWADLDRLLCVSDEFGWSRLALLDLRAPGAGFLELTEDPYDYGIPRWVPDMRSYAPLPDGRIVTGRGENGFRPLVIVDPAGDLVTSLDLPLTFVQDLDVAADGSVVATVARADAPRAVVRIDPDEGTVTPLHDASDDLLYRYASTAEPITWVSTDGAEAHGFLYRPRNPDVVAPEGELPPLIVTTHGGPTSNAVPAADRARTYWTSRGFAVLDVNYAGSTGFGRAYRERLSGQWGVADVADVATGARHLAESGAVDGARMAIRGGSAGGYLTLSALTRTDVFAAGVSLFGIADLCALATDTHKLESRYPWGLLAPWPQGRDVYVERSPLTHVDSLSAPLLLLQGAEDKVVPPNQAQLMADALQRRGIPHAMVVFEGEGHGFRVPANRQRATELELSFYGRVFGFEPDGQIEQIELATG